MNANESQLKNEINIEKINEENNKIISDRIKWIEYKNIPILFADYSNFENPDETIKTIQSVNDYILKLEHNEILLLVDVRNSYADKKIIIEALKNNAKIIKPYMKKVAVVGVTSTQEFILSIINMFSGLGIKSFETINAAKDWLLQ
jgi:hypothetical protein